MQAQLFGQAVVHAAVRGVQIRVHTDGGNVIFDEHRQKTAEPRIGPKRLHLALMPAHVHHRMVGYDELCPAVDSLLHHALGDIQRDHNALDLLLRVADEVADIVPVHRALARRPGKKALLDLTYRCHAPTLLFFFRALR